MMTQQIAQKYTLNFFDPEYNSNKVWIGIAYTDGKFETRFGRVRDGANLASKAKKFSNQSAAVMELERKRNEKLRKGYRETATVADGETVVKTASQIDLKTVAVNEIEGASADPVTRELVEYLAGVNIHNICAQTSLRYNAANATFSTPLGVLTDAAVKQARQLLKEISDCNDSKLNYRNRRESAVRDYFQLVPKDFGTRVPSSAELLSTPKQIQSESAILDALEAALGSVKIESGARVFECRLEKIPASTEEGRAEFRRINALYRSTKNANHQQVASLQLKRIYRVEMPQMKTAFEATSAKLGNLREDLWHGTRSSNLLSILKNGLIIPPSNAGHCTGRMFGNGIYSSLQSSKALNYATDFWNRSGSSNQRTFMFLCAAALGKTYKPKSSFSSQPPDGFDSAWIEAGTANVLNHECVVYDTAQFNLKYLCEFA
ncbi:MAG: WGR domain-containing protein [Acidobacteriota bacterium]|nr:WGR domain-containing protein [Acidobacteriota bacterium]